MVAVARDVELYKRPPHVVMRLARMGCMYQTRISFMRSLVRRMNHYIWTIQRALWALDTEGFGEAVYTVRTPDHSYSLVVFSCKLDDADRTDRVIAQKWDATFTLFDGIPNDEDMVRLRLCIPQQEAGRCCSSELIMSRANKSVRLFNYVVDCLSQGRQPDLARLVRVGYLMRTTAVYGNGKFGMADRQRVMQYEEMCNPYRAELLTVYLIRCFTHDLVDHIAEMRGGQISVPLGTKGKRALGIGNATGLGMAPYLHKHPQLMNNWFDARETALARVRAVEYAGPTKIDRFNQLLSRAQQHLEQWNTGDAQQSARIIELRGDLARTELQPLGTTHPWHGLMNWAEQNVSIEAQEMLASLILEPYPELVDELEATMGADETADVDPGSTLHEFAGIIDQHYSWALDIDFQLPGSSHWFWYVSREKLEPRIGVRAVENGANKEMPLGVARDVQRVYADLKAFRPEQTVAIFLAAHPRHRHIVRRIQNMVRAPYGEIQDNLLAEEMRPIDMLRSKLSFFGAAKFDPKSDRWTRITMFQQAPLPGELHNEDADDWCFPVVDDASQGVINTA